MVDKNKLSYYIRNFLYVNFAIGIISSLIFYILDLIPTSYFIFHMGVFIGSGIGLRYIFILDEKQGQTLS